ncbi:MAG TPA: sigma-54-dependent Fis family transcriptional regulator [Rhodospirillaceae bacterium]|nr:MAG: sigma-54-dependent Fis family transcriptional regulator [Alphaproteobacteria bacterium GWF2_58_20]HAU29105.1 sigma-54-dependent Fis family transcriptional regulator [Rhodospirillaceae bacterium]
MRLLIIGQAQGPISAAGRIAHERGARVAYASDAAGALAALRAGHGADLAMMDVVLDISGFISSLAAERINLPVVACGVDVDAGAAVRAIRAGAKEFVPLPPDAELIAAVLEAVAAENHAVIGRDPAMMSVMKLAGQVAATDATILITGESGTGKEVMARYIHLNSKRASAPFIAINCAAIPENLLESELFGHEKGAFTGATARRIGKFEEANGGTLLLDEVSEMAPLLQAKLLRAIQEREIERVGGSGPVKINIRLLATSNRNLEEEVRKGTFREDLYYRLNVINLCLPPLRDRPGDILPLAEHFTRKYCELNGFDPKDLEDGAIDKLVSHVWRGNIRELENTIYRGVLVSPGDSIPSESIMIQQGAPMPKPSAPQAQATLAAGDLVGRTVADVERDLIIGTLQHCFGNRTHAANILGISIRTLRNKLKAYTEEGLEVPQPGEGAEASA